MSDLPEKTVNEVLPTYEELIAGAEQYTPVQREAMAKQIYNQNPPDKWVKEHPMAKGVKYLPIEKVEYLLNSLFLNWRVEIKNSELIGNSVLVTVRLHYHDRVTNEWTWQDGLGAAPMQTDRGADATDWTRIKSDAVMKAAPAAESYAIKDASEKIGRIFGADLNRKDVQGYNLVNKYVKQAKNKSQRDVEIERIKEHIANAKTTVILEQVSEEVFAKYRDVPELKEQFEIKLHDLSQE